MNLVFPQHHNPCAMNYNVPLSQVSVVNKMISPLSQVSVVNKMVYLLSLRFFSSTSPLCHSWKTFLSYGWASSTLWTSSSTLTILWWVSLPTNSFLHVTCEYANRWLKNSLHIVCHSFEVRDPAPYIKQWICITAFMFAYLWVYYTQYVLGIVQMYTWLLEECRTLWGECEQAVQSSVKWGSPVHSRLWMSCVAICSTGWASSIKLAECSTR